MQQIDVGHVQAGGRLVEEKEARLAALAGAGAPLRSRRARAFEEGRELEALRLAAGERRGRLPEPQIAEADRGQAVEAPPHLALAGEVDQRLIDGEIERLRDVEPAPGHCQHLRQEPPALAAIAGHLHRRHELHVDFLHAGPLAVRTASGVEVEREVAGGDSLAARARGWEANSLRISSQALL